MDKEELHSSCLKISKGEERTVLVCSSKICQIRHVADDLKFEVSLSSKYSFSLFEYVAYLRHVGFNWGYFGMMRFKVYTIHDHLISNTERENM